MLREERCPLPGDSPLISIVIPVHNGSGHIRDCISSVLAQSYPKIEVLIIDDGSTDASFEIAKELAIGDSRVRVFKQAQSGVSTARNFGVKNALGAYVSFVDVDDLLHRESIRHLHSVARASGGEMAIHGYKPFVHLDEFSGSEAPAPLAKGLDSDEVLNRLLYQEGIPGAPWAKLMTTELCRKVAFPEGVRFAEDIDFSFNVLSNVKSVGVSNFEGYFYRQHAGSVMSRPFDSSRMQGLIVCQEILSTAEEGGSAVQGGARSRLLMESVAILAAIGESDRLWEAETRACHETIRRHRRKVLMDRRSSHQAKLHSVASYFPECFVELAKTLRRRFKVTR